MMNSSTPAALDLVAELNKEIRPVPILSVVFSFRNEEEVIPRLLERCRAVTSSLKAAGRISGWEFVFVDDDSRDASFEILKKEADARGDVRIIRMSRPFGVSICVLSGMKYSQGDLVVYMDTDLQDPPEMIPQLLEKIEADPEVDIVHTRRLSRAGETAIKLAITRLGYWILHKLSASAMPVEAGDFKLLTRRAVNEVLRFQEKQPFMRWLVCWIGFKQVFVPYHREARAGGESQFKIFGWRVISNFLESAIVSTSTFPLIMISFIGMLCSLVCVGVIVQTLIAKFCGKTVEGWTALMVSTLFIGSVQILCLGVIGLYIASIFDEVKRRPNYIIRGHYGFNQAVQVKTGGATND
jgi:glycosyltransferase involved in cell wall biosynthesis